MNWEGTINVNEQAYYYHAMLESVAPELDIVTFDGFVESENYAVIDYKLYDDSGALIELDSVEDDEHICSKILTDYEACNE